MDFDQDFCWVVLIPFLPIVLFPWQSPWLKYTLFFLYGLEMSMAFVYYLCCNHFLWYILSCAFDEYHLSVLTLVLSSMLYSFKLVIYKVVCSLKCSAIFDKKTKPFSIKKCWCEKGYPYNKGKTWMRLSILC